MQPVGLVFPMETGYRCFPGRPRHVRKPDVSFVSTARLPEQRLPLGDMLVAPDLAAEIVSPNDTADEVETKVAEYRSAGVRLIWIVYPPTRTVVIRRLDGSAGEVGPEGTIDGEDVLPGFRCSVAELFRLPIG
jgi:Uma2 family endonuclease